MARTTLDKLLARCRITDGAGFALSDHDPAETGGLDLAREDAKNLLAEGVARLSDLQRLLYDSNRHALLCVFQAMDAGGKDGTIRHVMSGVNPQGVTVHAFRQPGPEDLAHDFLWRISRHLPERGQIGIFNRSHYEEVVTVRVHPHFLEPQHLPGTPGGKTFWKHRLKDIAAFERYLGRQGIVIRKFFLHVSREEQRRRLLSRLDDPAKIWKFDESDLTERGFWAGYQDAYETAIAATATSEAPWYVIPADSKPLAHLLVVAAMIETLEALDLHLPEPDAAQCARLRKAREALQTSGT